MAALAYDWLRLFDFFSETAQRNSTKFDRKQDLKVLYQICVFQADGKNKMAMYYVMTNSYTKFQMESLKTTEKSPENWSVTERLTDGQTDSEQTNSLPSKPVGD